MILASTSAMGQIELTAEDFANEGDGYIYAVKVFQPDEELFISDLESKKWNLADIEPNTFDTLRIYKKERSRYGKLFPNAQLVKFHSRRDMEFITKDSNAVRMQGIINDYLGLKAAVVLIFPQDLDVYKFPIKQGAFLKDSLSKKFISSYGLAQFADSVRIDLDMSHTSYFDTVMEVRTPTDKYFALREKNTVTKNIIAYKNSHLMGWRPAPEYSVKDRTIFYRWFVKGVGAPVVEIETDRKGKIRLIRYQYREPMQVTIEKEDVKCKGEATGTATAVIKGGTPDYKYLWSNGKKTKTIKDLKAGTYSVTVTDSKGTKLQQSITIDEPAEKLSIKLDATPIRCYGDHDCHLTADVRGGTEPYYVVWSNDTESTELINQGYGIYGCIVRDANRCFVWDSIEVTAPKTPFKMAPKVTHSQCKGEANGEIAFDAEGGDKPYKFEIEGKPAQEINPGFAAGIYSIKATDKNGCELTRSAEVREPEKILEAEGTVTHVNCHGMSNGAVTLKVSGGSPGYHYQWSNDATTKDLTAAPAGVYNVVITDIHKCTIERTFVINQPAEGLTITHTHTDVACRGNNTGSIAVTATGGTEPYNITWSNKAKTLTQENLKAGFYTINISDKNNCLITETITISEPESGIDIFGETTDSPCKAVGLGEITTEVKNAQSPVNYLWQNGETSANLKNLKAGTYTLKVTDGTGCSATKSFNISSPENELTATIETTPATCSYSDNAKWSVQAIGGVPGYEYKFSDGSENPRQTDLKPGHYSVAITDQAGCTIKKEFEVTAAEPLKINAITHEPTHNKPNGSAELEITGGTLPYKIHWNDGYAEPKRRLMSTGEYYITVTDKNGCVAEHEIIYE